MIQKRNDPTHSFLGLVEAGGGGKTSPKKRANRSLLDGFALQIFRSVDEVRTRI